MKKLGKTRAVPVKNSKSDKKKGLRDRAKILVVTSFPWLFSLRPNRSEAPKCCSVVFKTKTETKIAKTPVNLITTELKRKFVKTIGSREKLCNGLVISVRKRRKKTAKTG